MVDTYQHQCSGVPLKVTSWHCEFAPFWYPVKMISNLLIECTVTWLRISADAIVKLIWYHARRHIPPAKWTRPANSWVMFSLTLRCLSLSTKKWALRCEFHRGKGWEPWQSWKFQNMEHSEEVHACQAWNAVLNQFCHLRLGMLGMICTDKQQFITPCFTICGSSFAQYKTW